MVDSGLLGGRCSCGAGNANLSLVCATDTEADCTRKRLLVRHAVEATWTKNAGVQFVGRGRCVTQGTTPPKRTCPGDLSDGMRGIRISVRPVTNASACPGTTGDGMWVG